ncbi:hypothetical protein WA158_001261 [Blastocystis sp. Blastoise]
MNSWPEISVASIKSELENIDTVDDYSILKPDSSFPLLDISEDTRNVSLYNYLFTLSTVTSIDISEEKIHEDSILLKSLYKDINNSFITSTNNSYTNQELINNSIKSLKQSQSDEVFIQCLNELSQNGLISFSSSYLPHYSSIEYPTEKQIFRDLLRDSLTVNDKLLSGTAGYQVITKRIMTSLYTQLGVIYKPEEYNIQIGKDTISNEKNSSNNDELSVIDMSLLMDHLMKVSSRTYSGDILYKAMEYLFPLPSSYIYRPVSDATLPIQINSSLVICKQTQDENLFFIGLQIDTRIQSTYEIIKKDDFLPKPDFKIVLNFKNTFIQGINDFKTQKKEDEIIDACIINLKE